MKTTFSAGGWFNLLVIYLFLTAMSGFSMAGDRPDGIYLIYDSSNSMWGMLPDGTRKYEAAREAMHGLVSQGFGQRDVALRMYGHRRKNDCSDTALEVPFSPPTAVREQLISAMEAARPTGRTPIDASLRAALEDFGDRKGSIILISDGIESCDADPCALVRSWRDRDVRITVHVVGLGLKDKERAAMECIAEAAGTEYRDAFSTDELLTEVSAAMVAGQGEELEPGMPEPVPQTTSPEFVLVVTTADGVRQFGAGTLMPIAGGEPIPVESFRRYTPEPGEYLLSAGVRVVGGTVYRPVEGRVIVAESGETIGKVNAPRPPQVSAEFSMEGDALRAAVVTVFQDGRMLGSFKGDASAFVGEGMFEFRARPPGTSQDLSVSETFVDGDIKRVSFTAVAEVHLTINATASTTGERLLSKPATILMRKGEEVDRINSNSGGLVAPGQYRVRIDDRLNRFEADIDVGAKPEQLLDLKVPTGTLTVHYQGVDGVPEAKKRVFVARLTDGRRATRSSSTPMALVPGRYRITGWPRQSGYADQELTISIGEEQEIILRATK